MIYKRGNVFWLKIMFEGKLYRKSTERTNRAKALDVEAKFRTDLINRKFDIIEKGPIPDFKTAMAAFLKWKEGHHAEHPRSYKRAVVASKPLLKFFKTKALDEIKPSLIESYKTHRQTTISPKTKRRLKPKTINCELVCMTQLYVHMAKEHRTLENPVNEVQFLDENNQQDRVLTFTEQRRYLEAASPTLRDFATIMLELGMRPDEVSRIQVEDVSIEKASVFIPQGKTEAARRTLHLTSTALAIIKRRIQDAEGSYIFPHRDDANQPTAKMNDQHDRAVKESKLKTFKLYALRHTWATRCAEGGMDLVTLAALLGHNDLRMVLRYCHSQANHRVNEMKRLEVINAQKQIEEVEKMALGTILGTVVESRQQTVNEDIDAKSTRIN